MQVSQLWEKIWLGWSILTVLYSPSMISLESVDLAVTFSLPGVPASNSSICHRWESFRYWKEHRHPLKNTEPNTFHSDRFSVPTHLCGNILTEELYSMLLHVISSPVGHFLVKAPQQNGPNHDGDVETQASKKTSTLQSHIRCSNHQGLSRAVRQRKQVITGGQGVMEHMQKVKGQYSSGSLESVLMCSAREP